jgi:hypothetical protein
MRIISGDIILKLNYILLSAGLLSLSLLLCFGSSVSVLFQTQHIQNGQEPEAGLEFMHSGRKDF